MSENLVTFDIELGLLNKGLIKEIERIAFKENINCKIMDDGGFLSKVYTIKLESNIGDCFSAYEFYKAIPLVVQYKTVIDIKEIMG